MIRRYCSLFAILLLLLPVACSRDKIQLRKALSVLERLQIVVPDDMLMIQDGLLKPYRIPDNLPLMIVYIGPEECSDCRISHITEYMPLFEWGEESGLFRMMIVFSPASEQMERIQNRLMSRKIEIPVYLDYYSEFHNKNAIPDDPRVHCFLLNEDRHPIFAGNPLASEPLNELFKTALDAARL